MGPVTGVLLLLLLGLALVGAGYWLGRAPEHMVWFADTAVEPHTPSGAR